MMILSQELERVYSRAPVEELPPSIPPVEQLRRARLSFLGVQGECVVVRG